MRNFLKRFRRKSDDERNEAVAPSSAPVPKKRPKPKDKMRRPAQDK